MLSEGIRGPCTGVSVKRGRGEVEDNNGTGVGGEKEKRVDKDNEKQTFFFSPSPSILESKCLLCQYSLQFSSFFPYLNYPQALLLPSGAALS